MGVGVLRPGSPDRVSGTDDLFRARWRLALDELGPEAAAEDAAQAFALRMRCSVEEGRAIVERAWRILGLGPIPVSSIT